MRAHLIKVHLWTVWNTSDLCTSSAMLSILSLAVLLIVPAFVASTASPVPKHSHIGCFNDGTVPLLPVYLGDFRTSVDPVAECARATDAADYKAFGIQFGGDCWSGERAQKDYNKSGKATNCHGGLGGDYANDVYFIQAPPTLPASCDISLPAYTSPDCQKNRSIDLRQIQSTYKLIPSRFGLFPELDMPENQLIIELHKDPLQEVWLRLYHEMLLRNQKLAHGFLNMTQGESFNSVTDYKRLLHFMANATIDSTPEHYRKYFRFHYQRPGKPFKKFTTLCDWREDRLFAEQRLAGLNPLRLQRVSYFRNTGVRWRSLSWKLNSTFDWEDAIQDAMGTSMSLAKALYYGHVYVAQYPLLDGIPKSPVDVPDAMPPLIGRVVMEAVSPIAIFVSKPSRRRAKPNMLVPVAIQMGHTTGSPVYTPDDGDKWLLAKQTVQVADFAYLGLLEHLLKLHMLMEPICVCVKRHLHPLHPLHQILKFHCRGVVGTNKFGGHLLLHPFNGTIQKLMAIGLKGGLELMKRGHKEFHWDHIDFNKDLERRGVLSKSRLPYYPYRDDGQLIHRAVQAMAGEYVDIYYKHNADVEADYELQNFANQVSADGAKGPDGGTARIKGFPPRVTSLCVLKKILTRLVWATSAAHSVANYPFNYYGLYTPSMPTKLYHDPKQTPGQFDIYNLPNKFTSVVQSALGMNLASMFYDTLFDYGKELKDARARSVVTKHSADLNGWILKTIEKRNRKRYEQNHLSYPYLVPGWIANSIHT